MSRDEKVPYTFRPERKMASALERDRKARAAEMGVPLSRNDHLKLIVRSYLERGEGARREAAATLRGALGKELTA